MWVPFQKERFLQTQKGKLSPRGDSPFKVLERINDNTYKINLPYEYNFHNVFNASDLSNSVIGDPINSRSNPFKKGEDETSMAAHTLQDHSNKVKPRISKDYKLCYEEGSIGGT